MEEKAVAGCRWKGRRCRAARLRDMGSEELERVSQCTATVVRAPDGQLEAQRYKCDGYMCRRCSC